MDTHALSEPNLASPTQAILHALPNPLLLLNPASEIVFVNMAGEQFFPCQHQDHADVRDNRYHSGHQSHI